MSKTTFFQITAALLLSFSVLSQENTGQNVNSDEIKIIADAILQSAVNVEYFLKYEKGEEPVIAGYICPNCNRFNGAKAGYYVKDNRPVQVPGYLISETEVISPDIITQPGFISKIIISNGKSDSPAKIIEYATKQQTVILKLEKQISGAKPAVIADHAKGPYFSVAYSFDNGMWQLIVRNIASNLVYYPEISEYAIKILPSSLIVNAKGEVAGISMNPE